MMETRQWLLKRHGPVCAYCGLKYTARVMTLDHVAPRRGQVAYDRRDNLVLACPACNIAKRDKAPLAFLLAVRSRAENLIRYGDHLSDGLFDLARSLVSPERLSQLQARHDKNASRSRDHSDTDSPYAD
jgi:hypothetical protein